MTPLRVSVVAALVSLGLLFVVLELIRRRSLRERYALLWLLTAAVMLVLSLWRSGLDTLAAFAGIAYAPSALFAIGAVFVVVVLLHYSTVISRLSDENAILAQRMALLEPLVERSLEPSDPAERPDGEASFDERLSLEAERWGGGGARRAVLQPLDAEGHEARVRRVAVEELGGRGPDPQPVARAAGRQLDRD